jgi:hypothetical protein
MPARATPHNQARQSPDTYAKSASIMLGAWVTAVTQWQSKKKK